MTRTAKEIAYDHLREGILSGELPASTQIRPEQIAQTLGISRMPVREALQKLHVEGLIAFGSNRRPVVIAHEPDEILELFEIRVALECLAVSRAVSHLTAEHLDALEKQLERMGAVGEDYPQWLQLHAEFHLMIYSVGRMPRLMEEIRRIYDAIHPFMLMYIDLFHVTEMPGVEHVRLIEVLRKHDPDLAALTMASHIRRTASQLVYFVLNGRQASAETLSKIYSSKLSVEKTQ